MNLTDIKKNIHLKSKDFLILVCVFIFLLFFVLFWIFKPAGKVDFKSEITILTAPVRTHFQKNPDYRGLSTAYIIKNALAPKDMIRRNKLYGKSKAEILIGRDINGNAVAPFEKTFTLTYLNLNKKNCLDLLTTDFDASSGLESISVSNDKFYEFTYGGELSLPINSEDAQTYCKQKNTVMLRFE